MDKRPRRDMISYLPLGIIHCILARVHITDAVKTSILSKQWRYIWATLPQLVFDDACDSNFINQALLLHRGHIHKFEFDVSGMDDYHYIDQWMLFLSRKNIRILILSISILENEVRRFHNHSSIYSCENLTDLELSYCKVPPPPLTFNGFLSLRSLFLYKVEISPITMESLLAHTSLLEKLVLIDISGHNSQISKLKIHAPNLKSLRVLGDYKEISLYAPLLAEMTAELYSSDFTSDPLQQKSSTCNYTKLLGSLTNLEELTGSDYLVQFLSIGFEPSHHSLVFHRLKVIDLCQVMFGDVKHIWVVVGLITGAPNLRKLKIAFDLSIAVEPSHHFLVFHHLRDIDLGQVMFGDVKHIWVVVGLITGAPNLHTLKIAFDDVDPLEQTSEVSSIPCWDSDFRFERLKLIEMRNVMGFLHQMNLAKFLLASSPVLETLNFITYFDPIDARKMIELTTELLSYRRSSPNAQILYENLSNLRSSPSA